MKAEIIWRDRRFIGIPYKTPNYRLVAFSDETFISLDSVKRTISVLDAKHHRLREFSIAASDIDHLYDFKGSITTPEGMLSVRPMWTGRYEFKHDRHGALSTDWICFGRKDRKDHFDLYAIISDTVAGVLDADTQRIIVALELAIVHNQQ